MRGALPLFGAMLAAGVTALLLAGASGATAPNNDSFSGATVLQSATGSWNGTTAEATKEAGEPSHAGNIGGGSTWYRWVAPYTGTATFDTIGSGFDSLLAVYTGSSVDTLTEVASNDDFMGWKWTSKVGFAATAGTAYRIAVDGFNDGSGPARGSFAVNWDLDATGMVNQANDSFANAVQIAGPGGSTSGSSFPSSKETGEPYHAGNRGGRSVWFRWTAPYDGTFTFSTDSAQFDTLLAVYSGIDVGSLAPVAANDDIAWNNPHSRVTFDASAGTVYSIAIDGKRWDWSGVASGMYTLDWSSPSSSPEGPANDSFAAAQSIDGVSGSASGSNVNATEESGEPNHAGNPGGASVWYSWTATATATVDFTTSGSSFDTLLAVYTGSSVGSLAPVAANDNLGQEAGPSEVTFTAVGGTTYRIAVDAYRAPADDIPPTGDVVLTWSMTSAAGGPANDDFDQPTALTGTGGIVTNSSLGASKEPGEPDHAGNPGGASVWFHWVGPGDGQWRFYTQGSKINTTMAVYTGSSVDALTLIASNDDVSSSNKSSSVTFVARFAAEYWIALDGYRGATGPAAAGDYTLQWELLGPDPALAPNDDFAAAWPLSGPSGSVTASNLLSTKQAGEPNHAGNPGGASVWFKWTAPANGYVSWDTPGSNFDTIVAAYVGPDVSHLTQVAANDNIQFNHWWSDGTYRESFLSFVAQQAKTYYIAVDGKGAPGGSPARGSIFMEWWQNPPNVGQTMLAAGDVHADCSKTRDEATAAIVNASPDATVAGLGDEAEPGSSASAYASCYQPSWGAFKSRTRPAVGENEYASSATAAPHFQYFGSLAGAPGKGFYSYEYGGWHVVVLNSNCNEVGGCGPGSEQYTWLQQDLAANTNPCSLAYWHHPFYASSSAKSSSVKPFWDLLYVYGTDVVVNAHARQYERFAPMTPSGVVDTTTGIRQFVVGTGGGDPLPLGPADTNSELVNNMVFGVLKLVLRTGGYDWQFLPAAGSTFTDSGRGTCSGGSVADTRLASAPAAPTLNATMSGTGQYIVSWKPSTAIPTGAKYSLWQKSVKSTTWSQVAQGLTATSYTFGTTNARGEGTWVYRVQATGAGLTSDFSGASAQVIVDKTAPLAELVKADRTAEYASGGWWKDQVTVSFFDNGDTVLADGSPGTGVNKSTVNPPIKYTTAGTFTASDSITDLLGWRSATASLTVKVDISVPTLTLNCGDVGRGRTYNATFTAADTGAGLATPPNGSVVEDSSSYGWKQVSVTARDKVGHATTKTCLYQVR